MTALIIVIAILLVFTILLFVPSVLEYSFKWNEDEKKTVIVFRYLFIKIVLGQKNKKEKTVKKNKKVKEKKKYKFEDVKVSVKKYYKIAKTIKSDIFKILSYAKERLIILKKIDISLKFDFEDPMKTGIYTGTINGAVYNVLGILDNSIGIQNFKVDIVPLFENRDYFDIDISGIVKIKNVHIMVILIKLIKVYYKVKKIK